MSNSQNWYPMVMYEDLKGRTGRYLTEHGKDLARFFEEEGMKADDENIRKWSEYLLQKLREAAPNEMPNNFQWVLIAPHSLPQ